MTNIKNKNKFLKISSIFLIGVFAVFLAFMPFLMNNNKDKVMADSVETNAVFTSSNILLNYAIFHSGATEPFNYVQDFFYIKFSDSSLSVFKHYSNSYYEHVSAPFTEYWTDYTMLIGSGQSDYLRYGGRVDNDFNYSEIVGVHIFTDGTFFNDVRFNTSTRLDFIDSSGKNFCFIVASYSHNSNQKYSSRYYYFTTNLTDNQFYNQGKDDGLAQGRAEGDAQGYQRGLDEGYSAGERYGYNEGLVAGADVSFLNLVGATVDAPVKAFNGLFDFNINLGGSSFNLKNFLIALLTIALIIAFVRLIMAK